MEECEILGWLVGWLVGWLDFCEVVSLCDRLVFAFFVVVGFVDLFCRLSLSVYCTFVQSCVVMFCLFRHRFVRVVVHMRY